MEEGEREKIKERFSVQEVKEEVQRLRREMRFRSYSSATKITDGPCCLLLSQE